MKVSYRRSLMIERDCTLTAASSLILMELTLKHICLFFKSLLNTGMSLLASPVFPKVWYNILLYSFVIIASPWCCYPLKVPHSCVQCFRIYLEFMYLIYFGNQSALRKPTMQKTHRNTHGPIIKFHVAFQTSATFWFPITNRNDNNYPLINNFIKHNKKEN